MKSIHDPRYVEAISKLRAAREKQGLSQAEVSKRLDKPQPYISKVETGERRIDLIETLDLCKALGIEVETIIPLGMTHLLYNKENSEYGK